MRLHALKTLQIVVVAVIALLTAAMVWGAVSRGGGDSETAKLAEAYVTYYSYDDAQPELGSARNGGNDAQAKDATQKAAANTAPVARTLDVDFESLKAINGDTAAWIYDSVAGINHPVVQTGNNEFYLTHSFAKTESRPGTIFFDCDIDINNSELLILYGHNMGKDRDEMFSGLTVYDKPPAAGMGEITLALSDGSESKWAILAVCHTNIASEANALYRKNGFADEADFNEYILKLKELQLYDTGISPQYGERIMMLSTCTGDISSDKNIRRIVFAVET